VRHSNTIGATRCLTWVLTLCVLGCTACLNPMPEEFPSERNPTGGAATGSGGGDSNYSETPGNVPLPTAPGPAIDVTPEVQEGSADPGLPGIDGNVDPDDVGDAGVPFAADAGGSNDGNP
jgi:hypothetical protein